MKKIGLVSDTHGSLPQEAVSFFEGSDEIWHAGDVGSAGVLEQLRRLGPVRAVSGNIDDQELRMDLPQEMVFHCERLKVLMTHIGGYPGKYTARLKERLKVERPGLLVCGHSHILKVMPDHHFKLLFINPGACGDNGWHHVKTMVRFVVVEDRVTSLEIQEIQRKGRLGYY